MGPAGIVLAVRLSNDGASHDVGKLMDLPTRFGDMSIPSLDGEGGEGTTGIRRRVPRAFLVMKNATRSSPRARGGYLRKMPSIHLCLFIC